MKVMIVDDEEDLSRLYEKMLRIHGHEVIAKVENGEDAVRLYGFLAEKPDMILMDYMMPKKDGIQAMQEILHFNPKQKIFFISGVREIKKKVLSMGAVGFEEKPVCLECLFQKLHKFSKTELPEPIPGLMIEV